MLLLHVSYEHFPDFCENLFEKSHYGVMSVPLSEDKVWYSLGFIDVDLVYILMTYLEPFQEECLVIWRLFFRNPNKHYINVLILLEALSMSWNVNGAGILIYKVSFPMRLGEFGLFSAVLS